jgi:hypothetical protein
MIEEERKLEQLVAHQKVAQCGDSPEGKNQVNDLS